MRLTRDDSVFLGGGGNQWIRHRLSRPFAGSTEFLWLAAGVPADVRQHSQKAQDWVIIGFLSPIGTGVRRKTSGILTRLPTVSRAQNVRGGQYSEACDYISLENLPESKICLPNSSPSICRPDFRVGLWPQARSGSRPICEDKERDAGIGTRVLCVSKQPRGYLGISTESTTWITPFDCMTSAIVTFDLPL